MTTFDENAEIGGFRIVFQSCIALDDIIQSTPWDTKSYTLMFYMSSSFNQP